MNGGYFPFMCKNCIVVIKNRCSNMEKHTVNNVFKMILLIQYILN